MFTSLFRRIGLVLLFSSGLVLFSCTGKIGYGVLSWSIPEHNMSAGDIVPVFIQSNIGNVYVIGTPSSKKIHIEVPLWQLTLYGSHSEARKAAAETEEFRYTYALVKLDGLPIRSEAENTARQIYRLKEGQKIKIITKTEGTPVFAGKAPLDGTWFKVMTDDGSVGYTFSYNLTLIDERDDPNSLVDLTDTGPDSLLENLLSRAWYPDSWRTMIEGNKIDLDKINPQWGFFSGKDASIARIENADGVKLFPYTAIVKAEDGSYRFEGSSLNVQIRRRNSILVQFTDENGMPQAMYFASLDTSPSVLIEAEKERRASILDTIADAGPVFVSSNYGILQFPENGRFLWSGYQLLSPQIIPQGAGPGGTVENRVFLSPEDSQEYAGVLSFRFSQDSQWIHFLYNISSSGLKLEHVSSTNIKDALVQSRNLTSTVLFFTPEERLQGAH